VIVPVARKMTCAIGAIDTVKPPEVVKQIVTGQDTEVLAKTALMEGCKEAGHKNCKIVVLFTECGAYASSQRIRDRVQCCL
jgi:hypothetical protein